MASNKYATTHEGDLEKVYSLEGDIVRQTTIDEGAHSASATKRDFSPLQIIALGFNVSNSWVAIAVSFAVVVAAGGPVTLIYGTLLSVVVYGAVGVSLAELASVYPTAGGQYHFTALISPKSFSRGLSYTCGVIATFSWIALCTAATIIAAQLLLSLPVYFSETYVPQAWHYFMVYQAVNVIVLVYNVFALKRMLWIHDIGFALTLITFALTIIVCLSLSGKQASSFVWTDFQNGTGWDDGVTFLTGLVTPFFMYAGLDASLHLAEECTNPRKTVPQALMTTVAIGAVTGLVFSIAMCYSISDLDSMLHTTMPIYELWRQATSSAAAATAFLAALFIILLFVVNAMQQTASHMIWAMARDDAVMLSKQIGRKHEGLDVPLWGLIANAGCIMVIGCLYLASSAAFNAFVNSSIVLQMVSFSVPCAILLFRGRSESILPRTRVFRVPSWLGWTSNAIVVVFAIIETVFFSFPTALPVSGTSMNYTAAVLAIMGIFGVINWFVHARKHYHGPITNVFLQ